jgi:hypothetical protein
MPLRFLLDEQLRGLLWKAIQRHNLSSTYPIDAVRVGDPKDLPLGAHDPAILRWAEDHARILISLDRDTLIGYFWQHIQAGHHSPGLLLPRAGATLVELVATLAMIAHAGDPADYVDQAQYFP